MEEGLSLDRVLVSGGGGRCPTGQLSDLPCREGRLEPGSSCDCKEAAATCISTGRGLAHCESAAWPHLVWA